MGNTKFTLYTGDDAAAEIILDPSLSKFNVEGNSQKLEGLIRLELTRDRQFRIGWATETENTDLVLTAKAVDEAGLMQLALLDLPVMLREEFPEDVHLTIDGDWEAFVAPAVALKSAIEEIKKSEPYIVEPISNAEASILQTIHENGANLDPVFWEQFKTEINRLVQRGYAYFLDTSGGGPGFTQRTVTLTEQGVQALLSARRESMGNLKSMVDKVLRCLPKGHE